MFSVLLLLLFSCHYVLGQNVTQQYNLSAVLSTQTQLTNFTTVLSLFPDLYDRASVGNITLLAPSDEAFAEFLTAYGNFTNETALRAGLSYHMLEGKYTSVDFEAGVHFLPTLLTDLRFSNVTGGQRIKVYSVDQNIMFESGSKTISQLDTSNLIYSAPSYGLGVIHVINKILKIPVDAFTTASNTKLDGVVDLSVGLPVNPNLDLAFGGSPDWTMFLPNSSTVDISTWPTDIVFDIQEYHFVHGQVWYSPDLKNGTQMKSFSGPNLTITIAPNGTKYLNDAEIIYSDYLINTGVMHVIDHGLSPNQTDARPNLSTGTNSTLAPSLTTTPEVPSSAPISSSSLSTAAKAGIGVGVGVASTIVIAAIFLCFRRHRRSHSTQIADTPTMPELKEQSIAEMQHPDKSYAYEADPSALRAQGELDGVGPQKPKSARLHEMQ